jgi:hypothetical protein
MKFEPNNDCAKCTYEAVGVCDIFKAPCLSIRRRILDDPAYCPSFTPKRGLSMLLANLGF